MKARNILWIIFLIVTVVELLAQIYGWSTLDLVAKPMLMPTLAAFFYFSLTKRSKIAYLFILALSLAWLGDVFLMFQESQPINFMLGLIFFLLAHIINIIIFRKTAQVIKPKPFTYATGLLLVMYGVLLFLLLLPGLGELQFPVIVYTMVITGMGLAALFRKANGESLVLVGAMLFIASDSLLATNKFYEPINAAGFWIMITYILAQVFITLGMLSYLNGDNQNQHLFFNFKRDKI